MHDQKPSTIADGTVEGLLSAIAKPKVEHPAQGQTAADFTMSIPDEMQGQQERRPMQSQDYYIRPDEGLRERPAPLVDRGTDTLPPQAPAAGGEAELEPPAGTPMPRGLKE